MLAIAVEAHPKTSGEQRAVTDETETSAAYRAFVDKRTFGALDGLRALAILAVLWHHTYGLPTRWVATQRGFLGVDLFFVVSGFLIVTLALRERDRFGTISLKKFYMRRFLRIFPIYYGLLFALALLFLTVGKHWNMRDPFFSDLPWALSYTSNWVTLGTFLSITWSLSAEEQFYLLWPPVERFLRRAAMPLLLALLLLSQLLHFRLAEGVMASLGFAPNEPWMLRQTTFTPILLGVLLAHALHEPRSFAYLRPLLHGRFAPLVAVVLIVAICSLPIDDITGWPRLSVHIAMAFLVGSAVIREDHALMPALRLAPLVQIGTVSYGMYLLHLICRHAAHSALQKLGVTAAWPLFPCTLAITVAVAWASYTFYESHFLKMKTRFSA
jgi:peptidoglycan/LPS O-acetylase OafA/YrhL